MKKIYYSVVALILLSIFFFTGCKKINEGPFPAAPSGGNTYNDLTYITPVFPTIGGASGILVSAQVYDEKTVVVTPFQNNYEYGMAQFASSPGNFTNLLNVGAISLDTANLAISGSSSYLSSTSNYSIGLSASTTWSLSGNSNLPSFKYTLNGVYPTYSDSFQNWANTWLPIPITNSLTTVVIPISQYVANADSVVVAFVNGSYVVQHQVAATVPSVTFTASDFNNGFPGGSLNLILQINAIKYRDTIVSGKKFYFLKIGSYIKYYTPTK